MNHFQLAGVLYIAVTAGNLGQYRLGNVVLGGAQATGRKYDIGPGEFLEQGLGNFFFVISHGNHTCRMDAHLFQRTGQLLGIGIQNLADKDFVTDSDDRCVNHCFSSFFSSLLKPLNPGFASRRDTPSCRAIRPSSTSWIWQITGTRPRVSSLTL